MPVTFPNAADLAPDEMVTAVEAAPEGTTYLDSTETSLEELTTQLHRVHEETPNRRVIAPSKTPPYDVVIAAADRVAKAGFQRVFLAVKPGNAPRQHAGDLALPTTTEDVGRLAQPKLPMDCAYPRAAEAQTLKATVSLRVHANALGSAQGCACWKTRDTGLGKRRRSAHCARPMKPRKAQTEGPPLR